MANKKDNIQSNSAEEERVLAVGAVSEDMSAAEASIDGSVSSAPQADGSAAIVADAAVAAPESSGGGEPNDEALADRVRIVSPFKLVIKRFFRSRLSVIGLTVFIAVLLFSFIGPLFVPWGQSEIDRSPAQRIQYNNISHTATAPDGSTYTYYTISFNQAQELNAHAAAGTYGIRNGKKALHVLGTDRDGYDIFARLMYGGRMSLMLSFLVVLIYTVIGIILGGLAGYFGGWVDMIIMRIVDILNCIPSLPILLIVGAIFDGSGIHETYRIYIMLGALTLLSWPGTARLVRGQILFLREQEYMVAADALGFSSARRIFKHLVPNVMPQLIVSMTLGLGGTILTEASLSFLGLGVPSTLASLGQMVSLATSDMTIMQYYIADWLPAGIIIILAVVAFNFIGDGLRDALDPKMKR